MDVNVLIFLSKKAARPLPYNATGPRLNNSILNAASLTAQLMIGSKGIPHKLPMVFYSMLEVFRKTHNEKQATSTSYSAISLALADEKDKIAMLNECMSYFDISPANCTALVSTKKIKKCRKTNDIESLGNWAQHW